MKIASIDIGTNTLRLLVAEVDGSGALKPLVYDRVITRLGGSFTEEHGLDAESAERTIEALCHFKKSIDEYGVDHIRAVATSALRRAVNSDKFLSRAKEECDLDIDIIEGKEEARLGLLGVRSVLDCKAVRMVVMDIGGGSTEFTFTVNNDVRGAYSLDMGVVALTERYLLHDPPKELDMVMLEDAIDWLYIPLEEKMLASRIDETLYMKQKGAALIGTAGTFTTLAAMAQELAVYDRDKINNYELSYWQVETLYHKLFAMPIKERAKILSLEKGREDLIVAGAAIALKAMRFLEIDSVIVSDAGLLEGIIIDKINNLS